MTYFSKLFAYHKGYFFIVCGFCLCTITASLTKLETTPFFVWGMYSEREKADSVYPILDLTVNDNYTLDYSAGLTDANRFFLLSPLSNYYTGSLNAYVDPKEFYFLQRTGNLYPYIHHFKKSLFNDATDYFAFRKWYVNYIERTTHINVEKVTLSLLKLRYTPDGHTTLIQQSVIETW